MKLVNLFKASCHKKDPCLAARNILTSVKALTDKIIA